MRFWNGPCFWLGCNLLLTPSAAAIWPFPARQQQLEGWSDAGNFGLAIKGRVVALGDWDGDQYLDLFVLSDSRETVSIHRWNSTTRLFEATHEISSTQPIENMIPADFNQDGRLDLLLISQSPGDAGGWWPHPESDLSGRLHVQGHDGSTKPDSTAISGFTSHQPILADVDGDLKPDLLGLGKSETGTSLQFWKEKSGEFERYELPLEPSSKLCRLTEPHSNAFVDLDGDCLPDLFVMCESANSKHSFQVWTNKKEAGFRFAGEWELPSGTGAITFADMDRDGTIDLVFPTCSSVSLTTGIGRTCSLNIAYNKQKPLCSVAEGSWLARLSGITAVAHKDCREHTELCTGDANFGFDLSDTSDSFTSIPVADLFRGTTSILFAEPKSTSSGNPALIPLRLGDFDIDGYPDILALVVNNTAAPPDGGIFGGGRSPGIQVKILQNAPCHKKDSACQNGKHRAKRRQFRTVVEPGIEALDRIWDARNAAWFDVGDDGALDVMVERSGKQDQGRIAFVENGAFRDAFFLKALVIDGACQGDICVSASDGTLYSSYGSNIPGGNLKFTIMDPSGRRVPAQVPQMPQTAYHALQAPFAFFGLGRTNNYIEKLFIGTSKHELEHYTTIEGVIPNSHIVINPPLPLSVNASTDVREGSTEWHKTLYLQPGKWIQWVIATATAIVVILAGITYMLHAAEKREDEAERRKTMHRINFAAFG